MTVGIATDRLRRRALALGLLVLAVSVVWLIAVLPIMHALEAPREEATRLGRLLATYRSQAATRPSLEAAVEEFRARLASQPGLIAGNDASLSAAQLQSEVKALVEQSGGTVRSTANLPSAMEGNYERVAVRFDLSLPTDRLQTALHRIESHTPHFFIDELHAQTPEHVAESDPNKTNPNLQIQWTVASYRWKPEP